MYPVKKGWKEITDGRLYDLFMEVMEQAMDKGVLQDYNKNFPKLFVHHSVRSLGTCYTNVAEWDYSYGWWGSKKPKVLDCSIVISDVMLDLDDDRVRKVIVHEVGHMCAWNENHGYLWEVRANKIGAKWGYEASRLESDELVHQACKAAREAAKATAQYEIYCTKCGKVLTHYKSANAKCVQRPSMFTHKGCGGQCGCRYC